MTRKQVVLSHGSTERLVLTLCSIVAITFVLEMLSHGLVSSLPPLSAWALAAIDATLLSILGLPALYYLLVLPLGRHAAAHEQAERALADRETQLRERERLEEEVREADARYRIATESVGDVIVTIDQDSRIILFANSAVEKVFGYSSQELLGKELTMLMPEGYRDAHRAGVKRYGETGIRHFNWRSTHVTGLHKSGNEIELEASYGEYVSGSKRYFVGVLRDVTESRSAAEALKLFRALIDRSNDAIEVVDPETGRLLDVNAKGCLDLGYCREELLALSVFDIDPTIDHSLFTRAVETLRTSGVLLLEGLHRRKNGSTFPVEVSISLVQLDREYAVAVVRDITERSQAQRALKDSERLLRESQALAGLGSYVLDIGAGKWRSSAVLDEILGIDEQFERTVEGWLSLVHPEWRERMGRYFADEIIGRHRRFDKEYQIVRRSDGKARWVHGLGELELDAQGTPVRMIGTIADITDRRQAETALRLQAAALHAAADAIVITERTGVIEWVNPAFTRLTGYAAEEALGRNPRDLVKSGKHAPAFYQEFWETLLQGRTWHGEMINRRKDGSLYTEEQSVTPIRDASGTITNFVAIKEDITERLQLEAQFRRAQKMESVGQLASGIAHDFNNLLTVINGMSELALEQVSEDSPIHADVQEIRRAGERAAALTRQLLAFSRQQILEPRVLNLSTVLTGMEGLLRRLLSEDIEIVIVPAPGVGNVKADPGQIEQVIANLAVNARDAMPEGGRLTFEMQNLEIGHDYAHAHGVTAPPGPYVMLSVSDSGVGMDQSTRARIFEPFFTTKSPGKGTGLGLATVYGIVKQSLGFIWVYSEVGHGTTFKIYLPQMSEAGDISRPEITVTASSGTETILVVEDDAALSTLVTRVLEGAGYTVLGVTTGEAAVRLLERYEEPVHLLLSDVVMPGMSGRHLAEQLAPTRPGMKVLYMSGYTSDTVVRHRVLEAQMAFLGKPFTPAALLRRVREVLDSTA